MAKKKLYIEYDDGSKIEYVIPSNVDWTQYWDRHRFSISIRVAWLRYYPFKSNEPIMLKE